MACELARSPRTWRKKNELATFCVPRRLKPDAGATCLGVGIMQTDVSAVKNNVICYYGDFNWYN